VFIDGRMEVMQEEFFEEYRSSFYQHGLLRLIERYKPDLIIFDYSVTLNWQRQLMTLPEWRCIYWDEKNVIYAHHFYAPYIKMVRFGSVLAHKGLDTAMTDAEAWDILKIKKDPQFIYWLKGFFLKRNYPHDVPMRMALFAYSYGDLRTAELLLLEFIRRIQAPMYEPYFNLGAVYLKMQDYIKARYCYEQVIQYDSNNLRAQQYLRAIPR
jgi:tetratricopeptide (TPR) repeat protein